MESNDASRNVKRRMIFYVVANGQRAAHQETHNAYAAPRIFFTYFIPTMNPTPTAATPIRAAPKVAMSADTAVTEDVNAVVVADCANEAAEAIRAPAPTRRLRNFMEYLSKAVADCQQIAQHGRIQAAFLRARTHAVALPHAKPVAHIPAAEPKNRPIDSASIIYTVPLEPKL